MTRTTRIVLAALALAAIATPAQAQLGGLIKKAAGKVLEDKAKEKVEEMAPEKPLEGDPVTASSIDGVLKGLSFEVQQQAEAVRLKAIQEKKSEAWNKLQDAGRAEADAYRAKNDKVLDCVNDALHALSEKHGEEAQAKIMSIMQGGAGQAEFIKNMTDVQQRMAEAMQKKDTAATRRLTTQYMKLMGVDLAADTASAQKTCGKPPSPPASYLATEKAAAELRDANEALRKVEVDLSERAAQTAGMDAKAYFLARERLWAWNNARKQKHGTGGVTKDENALFTSRAADIQKVEKALR